jgi:hypothetical protein
MQKWRFASALRLQISIFAYFPPPKMEGGQGMGANPVTECFYNKI